MGAEAKKHQQETVSIPNPNPNPNPISEAQFLAWKRRKDADASEKKDAAARKRAEEIAAGLVQMNGRELFVHEPWENLIAGRSESWERESDLVVGVRWAFVHDSKFQTSG
ncbi:zinc finger CCCH domain-containing protein 15 [Forsythia ovata]|uniref:Zinc finger CCCH domain-containing protein 15 n=1 Tax=Forsythia ovata TaxID=205694 RepID=A0ABD1RLG5_9LAMI